MQMYSGATSLPELDALLGVRGFRRQYCEANRWGRATREMNCLYSNSRLLARRGRGAWLWATGNSKAHRGQPLRSMVDYGASPPEHLRVLGRLVTSNFSGERVARCGCHSRCARTAGPGAALLGSALADPGRVCWTDAWT